MSGEQFGQGSEEDGLWVDMNRVDVGTLNKIKQKAERLRKKQKKILYQLG